MSPRVKNNHLLQPRFPISFCLHVLTVFLLFGWTYFHKIYMCFSGIRQLQLILLKVSLLLGVEVHTGVEFQGLNEPSGENGIFRRQPETTHLSVSLVALFLLLKKIKKIKEWWWQHVKHIKVCCVYKRLDGQAAACVSSGCNLPVWCLHLCWRRQVCPWWWDKHMHSTTLLLQKEGHRDVARAKMSTHDDNEPNFLWQPCSPRLLSSAHILLFSFLFPLCQDSSTRRWGASWLSALRPTSSTGTRLLRPRSLRSVAWHESTTRSSSNSCSLIPVGIQTREEKDYETRSLYSHTKNTTQLNIEL